ncbi:hypothetical protein MASR1M8_07780 [Thermomonas brevis]
MPRRLLLALALAAAACAAPLSARSPVPAPLVELDVVDRDTGQVLPEYRHRGQDWIAGTPGHRYAVRLTNRSGGRVKVVLSVDGVNAVSGETAATRQTGYVLAPWQSTEIAGWRKSLDDVAQFVFTDLGDSYAARTGRPDNVGVIGIAVFREAPPPRVVPMPAPPPVASAEAAQPGARRAMSAQADSAAPQSLGTGHGQREWAPVGQTEFRAASSRPQQLSQLRYDDARTLVARGILPRHPQPHAGTGPRAFPQAFVPDPPRGWR